MVKKEHGPHFEVLAIQALSGTVTLPISGEEREKSIL